MRFAAEPAHSHDRAERTAVLLTNLGTPDAPTAAAVRKYLAEFLSDPRVVEIPRALWWPILNGVILRTRPAKSAAKYAAIWTREGSPLATWTRLQADRLRGSLGERGHAVLVQSAMRYGQPSIASALDTLKAQGATRVLVLPLYPQYSAATTASTLDAVADWVRRVRRVPELRVVNQFHDDEAYLTALTSRVREHWMREGRGRMLLMSFHGLPARTLALGDPYHCQCQKTARLLAERLGLKADEYKVTFQSRFGRARWLEPATDATLRKLGPEGVERVDVLCPGFAADCLETLEEIGIEGRRTFITAGGKAFHAIACLNDHPPWIDALAKLAIRHLQGWPTAVPSSDELQRQRERAIGGGAPR
ncbi:MAG TPA: ferrochelatase [Burkholderiaceae bacterium]|nr:ferrochelatase [Burkholderiaceae bacterium]